MAAAAGTAAAPAVVADGPLWKTRFLDYFVVCGLGLDLRLMDGTRGFHGMKSHGVRISYMPVLIDRLPAEEHKKFKIPEMLPLAVLPGGLRFYSHGANQDEPLSFPRSYPIILTEGDGTKVYVSVLAFRDLVDDDVAQAYSIPPNSYADKCLCVVSHYPFLDTFSDLLTEIHRLAFQPLGSPRPIWDIIAGVMSVPLPSGPQQTVVFSVESVVLSTTLPDPQALPSSHVSFFPLVSCLDIDNIIQLFTAVLLERRVLLLGGMLKLLTNVAEAVTGLLYPYKWMLPYIPVLPLPLLELLHAPGIFIYGINTSEFELQDELDGVVLVDLDTNRVRMMSLESEQEEEDIPPLPEPEASELRAALHALIHPHLAVLESVRHHRSPLLAAGVQQFDEKTFKTWGRHHDEQFRQLFLRFLASVLHGYKDFVMEDHFEAGKLVFDKLSFLLRRSELYDHATEPFIEAMLSTLGWHNFFECELAQSPEELTQFDAIMQRAHNKDPHITIPQLPPTDFLTVDIYQALPAAKRGAVGRYVYQRFPNNEKAGGEQEARSLAVEKAMRAWLKERRLGRTRSSKERGAQREMMKVDTQVRLCQLWDQLRGLPPGEHPMGSEHYGTIYGMIESDPEGFGGSSFLACLEENITIGWSGELTREMFMACRELMLVAASRAGERRDYQVAGGLLEIAGRIYFRDEFGMLDFMRRYLGSLHVWHSQALWDELFEQRMQELGEDSFGNYSQMVMLTLKACAFHMVELGIADKETWKMLLHLASEHGLREKRQVLCRWGGVGGGGGRGEEAGRREGEMPLRGWGVGGAVGGYRVDGWMDGGMGGGGVTRLNRMAGGEHVDSDECSVHKYASTIRGIRTPHSSAGWNATTNQLFPTPPCSPLLLHHSPPHPRSGTPPFPSSPLSPQNLLRGQLSLIQLKFRFYGPPRLALMMALAPRIAPKMEQAARLKGGGGGGAGADGMARVDSNNTLEGEGGGAVQHKGALARSKSKAGRRGVNFDVGGKGAPTTTPKGGGGGMTSPRGKGKADGLDRRAERLVRADPVHQQARREGEAGMRVLRGHSAAVTALHVGSVSDLGDLLSGCDDAGYFVSGSADRTVKLWSANRVGAEMRATMRGHEGTVRAISSNASSILSGGDDCKVLHFDKRTSLPLATLDAHTAPISCVRFLSGFARSAAVTAGLDGLVEVWDMRSHRRALTVAQPSQGAAVLCVSWHEDAGGLIATGHTDGTARVWDMRAGREMHFLEAHSNWVSCVLVNKDIIITGSHDWTAKIWSVETGDCEKILTAHGGAVSTMDYCTSSHRLATGSADGMVRIWKKEDDQYIPQETSGSSSSEAVVAVRLMDEVTGVATASNQLMFLEFTDADGRVGGTGSGGGDPSTWAVSKMVANMPDVLPSTSPYPSLLSFQLPRIPYPLPPTPNHAPSPPPLSPPAHTFPSPASLVKVRHVAVDLDYGRMCSGSHTGAIRIWDAFPEAAGAAAAAVAAGLGGVPAAAAPSKYDLTGVWDSLDSSAAPA
ncbi:unnamed protein product [Closterium sp. Naga37s-1]|nr:unnamed protein product [Closterium sp. Naga37s-1]